MFIPCTKRRYRDRLLSKHHMRCRQPTVGPDVTPSWRTRKLKAERVHTALTFSKPHTNTMACPCAFFHTHTPKKKKKKKKKEVPNVCSVLFLLLVQEIPHGVCKHDHIRLGVPYLGSNDSMAGSVYRARARLDSTKLCADRPEEKLNIFAAKAPSAADCSGGSPLHACPLAMLSAGSPKQGSYEQHGAGTPHSV